MKVDHGLLFKILTNLNAQKLYSMYLKENVKLWCDEITKLSEIAQNSTPFCFLSLYSRRTT